MPQKSCRCSEQGVKGSCGPSQQREQQTRVPPAAGVYTHGRTCLWLSKWHPFYWPRRTGERKYMFVQGCIVDETLSVLDFFKKIKKERRMFLDWQILLHLCSQGPKWASRIQKLLNLSKDDVYLHVVTNPLIEGKKPGPKHPGCSILLLHMSCNINTDHVCMHECMHDVCMYYACI